MSLDIWLTIPELIKKSGTGVFVRRDGATVELSVGEVKELYPDSQIEETCYETNIVAKFNITHNLTTMADKAGLYDVMWNPTKQVAKDWILPLTVGLRELLKLPDFYKNFDSPNGWGTYENLRDTVSELLSVCLKYPDARIEINK